MLVGMAGTMLLAGGRADFIGATALVQTSTAITWPAGTQEGDLCILLAVDNYVWTMPGGWTAVKSFSLDFNGGTNGHAVYSRVVTASDLSSPPTLPTSGLVYGQWQALVYRGVVSATRIETVVSSAATANMAAIVVGGSVKKLLAIGIDRDPITPPVNVSGWIGVVSVARGVEPGYSHAVSDIDVRLYGGGAFSIPLVAATYGGIGETFTLS